MRRNVHIRQDVADAMPKEELFRQRLEKYYQYPIQYNPDRFIIDFSLTDKQKGIHGFIEIKCRKIRSDKYPTYFIGIRKWAWGVKYYEVTGIPFLVAFTFTDEVDAIYKYDPIDKPLYYYEHSGRTKKTRDNQDIAPVVHLPSRLFTIINKPK